MKLIKKLLRKVINGGINTFIVLISVFEAPIFLFKNRRLFTNKIVYVFYHHSFGHTISGIDFASRLYFPHRISLIHVPHPRSNSFLGLCFSHNVDTYVYKSLLKPRLYRGDVIKYRILVLLVGTMSSISRKFQIIDQETVYKSVSLAQDSLEIGDEKSGRMLKSVDYTGYVRLLRDNVGSNPALPVETLETIERTIRGVFPNFFDRPFVVLQLKRKGMGGQFDDHFRCSGPHENYLPAVRYLIENGYHVVGSGETDHSIFSEIPGYFSLSNVGISPQLLSLYTLTRSKLFIGQQSGPHILPNSCGILCVICDAMPYRLGTFKKQDIFVFKRLVDAESGKVLSVAEVFRNHKDLAFGMGFLKKKIDIIANDEREIFEAVREGIETIEGKLILTNRDRLLIAEFLKLPSSGMAILYHGNRVSLNKLHEMQADLISEDL